MFFFWRLLLSWWRLLISMFVGLFFYGYMVLSHPGDFRQLKQATNNFVIQAVDKSHDLGVPYKYSVWVDVLNIADKLLFMVFVFIARLLLAFLGLAFSWPISIFRKKQEN